MIQDMIEETRKQLMNNIDNRLLMQYILHEDELNEKQRKIYHSYLWGCFSEMCNSIKFEGTQLSIEFEFETPTSIFSKIRKEKIEKLLKIK